MTCRKNLGYAFLCSAFSQLSLKYKYASLIFFPVVRMNYIRQVNFPTLFAGAELLSKHAQAGQETAKPKQSALARSKDLTWQILLTPRGPHVRQPKAHLHPAFHAQAIFASPDNQTV